MTPAAIQELQHHDWPGNIRELRNLIERHVIMTTSAVIDARDIQILKGKPVGVDYFSYRTLKEARDAFEREFLMKKIEDNNWNISKTAEILDIERSNLHRKIKAYNIQPPGNKEQEH
jgi:two-component system nitrogen regulation response regulator NtrX